MTQIQFQLTEKADEIAVIRKIRGKFRTKADAINFILERWVE